MRISTAILMIVLTTSLAVAFQENTVPLAELDKYKLQAAEATASFEALRMETVIRNFIESNPQVKAWSDAANKALADQNALRTKLFEDAKLSPADYELRAADGVFVKIEKTTER